MNRAKSPRRVRLLLRMGSPTCRLHTGRPWLSPTSRSCRARRSARVAGEHAPARLHLVVEVGEASEAREPAADLHERFELPRVHVLAVARDVPPAREHEVRPRSRVVEHRLDRSRRVLVDPPRDQHDEHPVAPGDRALDDLGVVRRSRNDSDAPLVRVELLHALLSTHANHLVASIKRVLHHALAELPRGPDDADPHRARPSALSRSESLAP
jgi:hypothetical protein